MACFTDQENDPESGLMYYGARYYDPWIGRFLSQDPGLIGSRVGTTFGRIADNPQNFNAYSYALNAPTRFNDPTGAATATVCSTAGGITVCTTSGTSSGSSFFTPSFNPARNAAIGLGIALGAGYVLATGNSITSGGISISLATNESDSADSDEAKGGDEAKTGDEANYTDKPGKIAEETGKTAKEVKEAIHKVKEGMSRDTGNRNPDVKVDPKTGDTRPINPDGSLGDSIGNIKDFL